MSVTATMQGQNPTPLSRRISPVVWVLGVLLVLFLLMAATAVGTGIWIWNRVADRPLAAAEAMIAAANPDLEIVTPPDVRDKLIIRDKRTGKTVTLSLDQIREGKIIFTTPEREVVIEAGSGGVRVNEAKLDAPTGPAHQ